MTTLRRELTKLKPDILSSGKIPSRNSEDVNHPDIQQVKLWLDFALATLNASFGDLIDLNIPAGQLEIYDAEDFFRNMKITKPDDTLRLVEWNDKLLRSTLAFAKQRLGLYQGVHLKHHISTADGSVYRHSLDGGRSIKIDHHVALDDFPLPNLVMGLALPSSKFQGSQLAAAPEAATAQKVLPLRRLASLCYKAKTRYGYIVTEEALVICRFHKLDAMAAPAAGPAAGPAKGPTKGPDMEVALMPIPWSRHGESQLTTDLALWWLCMLALSAPEHRALVTEAEMVAIGEWEVRYLDDEHRWVRRHCYSGVQQAVPPPAPPGN